jgi:hypothetical protein
LTPFPDFNEALAEIFFVLESYPATTSKVKNSLRIFLSGLPTTDVKEAQPSHRKIHSAEASFLEHRLNFNDTMNRIRNVYETFSGYVTGGIPT